jgi:feruloyl esterase
MGIGRTGLRLAAAICGLLLMTAPPVGARAEAPTLLPCRALPGANWAKTPDAPSRVQTVLERPQTIAKAAACVVDGYTNPAIGWRLWLPIAWNGKLAQDGCGGRCGERRDEACELAAMRGYACIAVDFGKAGANQDNVWAIDNLQGEVDTAFRGAHVANRIARAIVLAHYGRPPAHAYYFGISVAGRQGLVAAERFPDDFDGIIAGEPSMRGALLRDLPSTMTWAAGLLAPGGRAVLSAADVQALHRAVLARCDLDDNLKDGVISDPLACRFDPGVMLCHGAKADGCLSAAQIAVVRALYAGQGGAGAERVGLRFLPGSELRWIGPYMSASGGAGHYPATPPDDGYRNPYAWILNDSSNADLRAFRDAGGKMILFQGWADEITLPEGAVDFYDKVEALMGGRGRTEGFLRFYAVPGQGHTPGGPGPEVVDYLSALEAWVERGQAPETLKGYHLKDASAFFGALIPAAALDPANVDFTRPIYRYPLIARYKGNGDPNAWTSFAPAASKAGR